MITRRLFITACCALCASKASGADQDCWQPDAGTSNVDTYYSYSDAGHQLETSSGDKLMDLAFQVAYQRLSEDFEVKPGFGYTSLTTRGPAYATTNKDAFHREDGAVIFSRPLVPEIQKRFQDKDAAFVAIAAHEFGHIVQYKRKLHTELGGAPLEQHADFLSGWFAGKRAAKNRNYPAQAFVQLAQMHGNPGHGLGVDRARAVQEGIKSSSLPLTTAIQRGFEVVRKGTPTFQQAPVTSYR